MFASEANIHENKFNSYKMPASLLVLFLEKALTLIHMETHLTDDSEEPRFCKVPFSLLEPHVCDIQVATEQEVRENGAVEKQID